MMKSFLAIACAALMTCGLQAQISGSINRGAAKVSNSIEMGGNKLSVNYTALRFGDGMWQKIKDAADRHEGFNAFAEKRPVGSVETSVARPGSACSLARFICTVAAMAIASSKIGRRSRRIASSG